MSIPLGRKILILVGAVLASPLHAQSKVSAISGNEEKEKEKGKEKEELQGDTYQVVRIKGQSFALPPLTANWMPLVKGMQLSTGSLVQVTQGSTVRLRQRNSQSEKVVEIEFTQPLIVRLSPEILRDIKTKQHVVGKLNKVKVGASPDKQKKPLSPFEKFSEAWSHNSILFQDLANELKEPKPEDLKDLPFVTKGVSVKPLKVHSPMANISQTPRDYPTGVKVRWETPDKEKPQNPPRRFKIYAWSKGEKRGEHLRITSDTETQLPIGKPGSYYVQVITEDGTFASPPVSFEMEKPLVSKNSNAGDKNSTSLSRISILEPPPNLNIIAGGENLALELKWNIRNILSTDVTYLVVVAGPNGTEKIATDDRQISYRFAKTGIYRWHVEVWPKDASKRKDTPQFASSTAIITIAPGSQPSKSLADYTRAPGGYYFVDGMP